MSHASVIGRILLRLEKGYNVEVLHDRHFDGKELDGQPAARKDRSYDKRDSSTLLRFMRINTAERAGLDFASRLRTHVLDATVR